MILNSTMILFYSNMLLGVVLSLSSNNWVMVWVGLEMSLMTFIPMMSSKLIISSESAMKYFIVQSMSSSLFIMGVIMMMMKSNVNYEMIINLSMMIKMGMSPFHSWILSIIEGLSYMMMFNLFTIMKIVPMLIISHTNSNLNLLIMISMVVGSTVGLSQNSIRKVLAYSSIFNMGFLLYSLRNLTLWILYFIIYSVNLLMLTKILMANNINYLNQLMINKVNLKVKFSVWILILSLGGMPPMMGFLSKMIIIELSIFLNDWLMSLIMISTSLLVMFYYNRTCYMITSISSLMTKWKMSYYSWLSVNIVIINMLIMPSAMIIKYLT